VLLYSTNTALKYRINRDYLGGLHYCWCSENFDARKVNKYARGGAMPPSSDPCSIYRELREAVQRSDEHCDKIKTQKANLTALAAKLHADGKISGDIRDEVVEMVKRASFLDWTPYVYVIPSHALGSRLKPVAREKRASAEMEYIVEDLKESEFHILEFP
jgi:hypothetical protein